MRHPALIVLDMQNVPYHRDWPVVLVAECSDSSNREHHEISVRYLRNKLASALTNRGIASALAAL